MLSLYSRNFLPRVASQRGCAALLARRNFRASSVAMNMEKVTFGQNLPGYAVGPASAPGVIMLQEWWGVSEEIKKQANRLSQNNYRVLIPDLYKGKLGLEAEEASHLMSNLDFVSAIDEIRQASEYLLNEGSPKVGAIGFCMGGALTLCSLQHDPRLACGIVFYGTPDRAVCQPEKITKPVQCHFGERDNMKGFSDPVSAKKLVEHLQEGGVPYEMHYYTGVGHAFMNENPQRPQITPNHTATMDLPPAMESQRQLAWSRLVEFFRIHLSS